ncbi:hypothetical protein HP15_p187g26 (plasmid) [Marinobacter adhaerens HP15]|uniref:Uncharacterized protein n=1 Tax=Marinobacter adhaerens (strain DSM 23420 / HP15) TaxID=225937 RepID=E4PRY8_MARAH|nr:hypothetical protein HP15_p187g26 [Marinobacter adhaerens HP15]
MLPKVRIIEGKKIARCSANSGTSGAFVTAELYVPLTDAGETGPFSKFGPNQSR